MTLSAPTLDEVRALPATCSVAEAAAALGISKSWGFQLVKSGEFPCATIAIRGRTRVITASLISLLEGGR
jgi:hypothetical protein